MTFISRQTVSIASHQPVSLNTEDVVFRHNPVSLSTEDGLTHIPASLSTEDGLTQPCVPEHQCCPTQPCVPGHMWHCLTPSCAPEHTRHCLTPLCVPKHRWSDTTLCPWAQKTVWHNPVSLSTDGVVWQPLIPEHWRCCFQTQPCVPEHRRSSDTTLCPWAQMVLSDNPKSLSTDGLTQPCVPDTEHGLTQPHVPKHRTWSDTIPCP